MSDGRHFAKTLNCHILYATARQILMNFGTVTVTHFASRYQNRDISATDLPIFNEIWQDDAK